ncbi:hypothetical protein [Salmonella phage SKML-39]|uniref:Uncharacterized protein n=1 Tax=Salmonella phage SKML-39 TaxID=1204528 RepID=K4I316_9CAUD|nr:hypothetical protein G178_gp073 [Salmonella phage SKML-39]AFU64416.1 hypothetical protein [Salmonella phage SKML-39]
MKEDNVELFEAGQIAADTWNAKHKHHKVAVGVKAVMQTGNVITIDGTVNFYERGDCLDGQFTIGKACDWNDPLQFVYGWLECIEESYHLIYE